jgi:hypothetical protein
MARALTEGWLLDDPEKLRELREEMYRIATGRATDDPRKYGPADRIAAYRALQENVKIALAEAKQEQEASDPLEKPEIVKVLRGVTMEDL